MPHPRHLVVILIALACGGIGFGVWLALRTPTPSPELPFPVRFVNVTDRAAIHFRHFNGATGKKILPETMGSGVAVLDFDGDGRPDILFINSRSWPGQPVEAGQRPTPVLYRNKGDGTFEDVTVAVGLDVELFGMGVAVADYDNDGWPDIFITAIGGNKLFRNIAGKRFEDVTATAGVGGRDTWPTGSKEEFLKISNPIAFPSSAVWLDFDGDGLLDLFVCNYLTWSPAKDLAVEAVLPNDVRAYVPPTVFPGTDCTLFRNVGGRFEDVTAKTGIRITENGTAIGKALGVSVCDPDRDGWPDIIVACDTTRNLFFHNIPASDGGRRFEEIGLSANVAYSEGRPRGGMGIDAAEILPDIFAVAVVNFSNEPNTLLQLRHTTPLGFMDIAVSSGLAFPSRSPMKFGAMFFDADLDGRPDFFTCNGHLEPDIASAQVGQTYAQSAQLFWNSGDPSQLWKVATPEQIGPDLFKPLVGRGCAYLDFDGDGALDIVVTQNGGPAQLFRNENATGNNWVSLKLIGNGKTTNRDGIGAEIAVEAGGKIQRKYITTSRGYLSQSDIVATFGLGAATLIDRVTVRWPGRDVKVQTWSNLGVGKRHELKQEER
ncbi:MAG TPA: CRTAC1 family protein [Gemmata sp.]|nr:CRTAC1 family protein [Gemmata sp.]